MPEECLCHPRHDLATEPAREVGLVDHGGAPGLADRRDHRVDVERVEPPQVDDLDVDTIAGEMLGGGQAQRHAGRPRHEGGIGSCARDPSTTDRLDRRPEIDVTDGRVEHAGLDDDHGVVAGDRSAIHLVGVVGCGGDGDPQPRRVDEVCLDRMRVLRACTG